MAVVPVPVPEMVVVVLVMPAVARPGKQQRL
jgi:hypothetical protein